MLIDLNTFIKVDSIRRKLSESCVVISNIEEADKYVIDITMGIHHNAIFEKSSLKTYCFKKIQDKCGYNIINCNSCIERFDEQYNNNEIFILDNINQCKDINILNKVLESKSILVC